jgi:hypothetical protein
VCEAHINEDRFVSGFTALGDFRPTANGVEVTQAVWCGICELEFKFTA